MSESADSRPILIAYDGSDHAKAAIAEAGRQLAPGRRAIVLTVAQPLQTIPFLGAGGGVTDQEAVDAVIDAADAGARGTAEEGARLAAETGFEAEALVEAGAPPWQTVVAVADQQDAGLIVLGSRGRSGLTYVMLGSVATAVAQHSKRPVLIAHSAGDE